MQNKDHWENVYKTKNPTEVSWTQDIPKMSLDLILSLAPSKTARIIDTCCGAALPESVLFGPNPSTADKPGVFTFFVAKEQSASLTIYDSAGRLVYRYTRIPEGQSTLPFPQNLAMGVYHYVFESNSGFEDRGKILVGD